MSIEKKLSTQSVLYKLEDECIIKKHYNKKILCLTYKSLTVFQWEIPSQSQSIDMNGQAVAEIEIGGNNYVAIMYMYWGLEVRKLNRLKDVIYKLEKVEFNVSTRTPKMTFHHNQLYLVYPDKILIIDLLYNKRQLYTNMLDNYPGDRLQNVLCSNLMDGEKLIILHQQQRLVFTIMPLTVTEIKTQKLTNAFILSNPKTFPKFKRQYLVIVTASRYLKVYDFFNLKQICEIDFGPLDQGGFIGFSRDPNNQFILVSRFQGSEFQLKMQNYHNLFGSVKNYLLIINKEQYYMQQKDILGLDQNEQDFFVSIRQLPYKMDELFILGTHKELIQHQAYTSVELCYFKDLQFHVISHVFKGSQLKNVPELKQKHSPQWKENTDWSGIISSYIAMSTHFQETLQKSKLDQIQHSPQKFHKQITQFDTIKYDLQQLVQKFHNELIKNTTSNKIQFKNEEQQNNFIQNQWNTFFDNYLQQNNIHVNIPYTIEVKMKKDPPIQNEKPKQSKFTNPMQISMRPSNFFHQDFLNYDNDNLFFADILNNSKKFDFQQEYHNFDQQFIKSQSLQLSTQPLKKRGNLDELTRIERQKLQKQKIQKNLTSKYDPFLPNPLSSMKYYEKQFVQDWQQYSQRILKQFSSQKTEQIHKIRERNQMFHNQSLQRIEQKANQAISSIKSKDSQIQKSIPKNISPKRQILSSQSKKASPNQNIPPIPDVFIDETQKFVSDQMSFLEQQEVQYQQFVKKFIKGLKQAEQREKLQKLNKQKQQEENKRQLIIFNQIVDKIENEQMTIDEFQERINQQKLNQQFVQELKLKLLQVRFKDVVLGKRQPPNAQEIDKIFGKYQNQDTKVNVNLENNKNPNKKQPSQKQKKSEIIKKEQQIKNKQTEQKFNIQNEEQLKKQRKALLLKIQRMNQQEEDRILDTKRRLAQKEKQRKNNKYLEFMPQQFIQERLRIIHKLISRSPQYFKLLLEPSFLLIIKNAKRFHNGFFQTFLQQIERYELQNFAVKLQQEDNLYSRKYIYFKELFNHCVNNFQAQCQKFFQKQKTALLKKQKVKLNQVNMKQILLSYKNPYSQRNNQLVQAQLISKLDQDQFVKRLIKSCKNIVTLHQNITNFQEYRIKAIIIEEDHYQRWSRYFIESQINYPGHSSKFTAKIDLCQLQEQLKQPKKKQSQLSSNRKNSIEKPKQQKPQQQQGEQKKKKNKKKKKKKKKNKKPQSQQGLNDPSNKNKTQNNQIQNQDSSQSSAEDDKQIQQNKNKTQKVLNLDSNKQVIKHKKQQKIDAKTEKQQQKVSDNQKSKKKKKPPKKPLQPNAPNKSIQQKQIKKGESNNKDAIQKSKQETKGKKPKYQDFVQRQRMLEIAIHFIEEYIFNAPIVLGQPPFVPKNARFTQNQYGWIQLSQPYMDQIVGQMNRRKDLDKMKEQKTQNKNAITTDPKFQQSNQIFTVQTKKIETLQQFKKQTKSQIEKEPQKSLSQSSTQIFAQNIETITPEYLQKRTKLIEDIINEDPVRYGQLNMYPFNENIFQNFELFPNSFLEVLYQSIKELKDYHCEVMYDDPIFGNKYKDFLYEYQKSLKSLISAQKQHSQKNSPIQTSQDIEYVKNQQKEKTSSQGIKQLYKNAIKSQVSEKSQFIHLNENVIELIYDMDTDADVINKMKKQIEENIERQIEKNRVYFQENTQNSIKEDIKNNIKQSFTQQKITKQINCQELDLKTSKSKQHEIQIQRQKQINQDFEPSKRQAKSKSEIIFSHQPLMSLEKPKVLENASQKPKESEYLKVESDNVTHEQNQSAKNISRNQFELKKSLSESIFNHESQSQDFIGHDSSHNQVLSDLQLQANKIQLHEYLTEESQRLFAPVQQSFFKLSNKLSNIQQTCGKVLDKFQQFVQITRPEGMESMVKRYFVEMMGQLKNTVNEGYKDFQRKIQKLEQTSQDNFSNCAQNLKNYFAHQVKHRLEVFDKNRSLIQQQLYLLKEDFNNQQQQTLRSEQELIRLFRQKYHFDQQLIEQTKKNKNVQKKM